MPELPEVQTVVDTLGPRLVGRRIDGVEHIRDDMVNPAEFDLRSALAGRTVMSITRRGKRIVFELNDGNRFYIHLGMSGRLTMHFRTAPVEQHTHLIVAIDRQELRFRDPRRFGGIFWIGSGLHSCEEKLGPEPLLITPGALGRRLKKTKRAIKNALLDQTLIAGLGNIYVDESLFAARIHPLKRADKLKSDEVTRLNRSIKQTLRRAIKHRGSTLRDYTDADGAAGGYQKLHRVYGREEKPCPSCRARIKRIVLGARSTHFCPKCQRITSSRVRSMESPTPPC